jgi:hypothetical protein
MLSEAKRSARSKMSMLRRRIHGRAELRLQRRPFSIELAVQMTEHPNAGANPISTLWICPPLFSLLWS